MCYILLLLICRLPPTLCILFLLPYWNWKQKWALKYVCEDISKLSGTRILKISVKENSCIVGRRPPTLMENKHTDWCVAFHWSNHGDDRTEHMDETFGGIYRNIQRMTKHVIGGSDLLCKAHSLGHSTCASCMAVHPAQFGKGQLG